MRLMLDYFSEYFTEEQLQANMSRYNLENMLAIVKDYFLKEYGYVANNIAKAFPIQVLDEEKITFGMELEKIYDVATDD